MLYNLIPPLYCISRTATGDKNYRKEYQNNYVVVFKSLHLICAWISFFSFSQEPARDGAF